MAVSGVVKGKPGQTCTCSTPSGVVIEMLYRIVQYFDGGKL